MFSHSKPGNDQCDYNDVSQKVSEWISGATEEHKLLLGSCESGWAGRRRVQVGMQEAVDGNLQDETLRLLSVFQSMGLEPENSNRV